MRIAKVHIENFRCIKSADITFPQNAVIVGDNNCGKSTLIEAIDLVLGSDRALRRPVINEYDFFAGKYRAENEKCEILIEITLVNSPPPKEAGASQEVWYLSLHPSGQPLFLQAGTHPPLLDKALKPTPLLFSNFVSYPDYFFSESLTDTKNFTC